MKRNAKKTFRLKQRFVCHAENGLRSVPIEKTIQNIENFFLHSPLEIQFTFIKKGGGGINRAILKYHSPEGKSEDKHYFGKGLTIGQNIASAGFEFFERYCAMMRPDDKMTVASYEKVSHKAADPRLFDLGITEYNPNTKIDWVWGHSLTREIPVLVPANLVFLPYRTEAGEKYIVLSDSNGIASGNNMEEAILHALLEVIERDQVNISEYNRFPFRRIVSDGVPEVCHPLLINLKSKGFRVHLLSGYSDLPVPFMAVFLQHRKIPSRCAVAYGSYPDPVIALERALTEAVQMLPPSASHKEWLASGSPQFFQSEFPEEIEFSSIQNMGTNDLRENIDKCVAMLKEIGSEVFVVNLSRPDIPFPTVRVLVTGLQPRLNADSMRLSGRFFEVPVRLGFRKEPLPVSDIKLWSICGYR
jgi:ribosomal protein S12 methylthiotransferase accessory factor YcaO